MGNEAICKATFAGRKGRGKALLETNEIIFRGEDESVRFKLPFKNIKAAAAIEGQLRLETGEGDAVLELGANAAKWCDKILHPKSRIDKLGVKPGAAVRLIGTFDKDFTAELGERTGNIYSKSDGPLDFIFLAANSLSDLRQLPKLARTLKGSVALWIVYPKGQKELTENEVLSAGRKSGLKDLKVVGFSPTLTALKFVIPAARRQRRTRIGVSG